MKKIVRRQKKIIDSHFVTFDSFMPQLWMCVFLFVIVLFIEILFLNEQKTTKTKRLSVENGIEQVACVR